MNKKIFKILKISLIVILVVLVLSGVFLVILFNNELRTLASLKKVDDYGMYQMTYYGDYGFDEFLEVGATNDIDLATFVAKKLLKGLPVELLLGENGCTAFMTKNENGDVIFARNYDFDYAPSLQLYTKPKNGYASVSTVDLSAIGYGEVYEEIYEEDHAKDYTVTYLPTNGIGSDNFLTLISPYIPVDGMNEKGLAVAALTVPLGLEPPLSIESGELIGTSDPNKITLNTTTTIRLLLDKAANVDEAIELLRKYNIYFSAYLACHFLVADSTGKSVIIEYYDNDLRVVEPKTDYQAASNFIAYNDLNISEDDGYAIERYDKVMREIAKRNNSLDMNAVIGLLNEVGSYDDMGIDMLQWSVIYNLTDKTGKIWPHRNAANAKDFELH